MTGKEEFFFQRNDASVIRVHIVGLYNPKSKRKSHYFYYGEEANLHEIDGWSGASPGVWILKLIIKRLKR
jgi:hypothetical protein